MYYIIDNINVRAHEEKGTNRKVSSLFSIQIYNAIYASPVRHWNHRHVNCLALYLPDKVLRHSHRFELDQ